MTIPKNRDSSGTHVPYIVRTAVVGLTLRFSRGASMIAPSADGCKRRFGGMNERSPLRTYSPAGEVVFPARSDWK
jgi:hypothetical protein